MVERFLLVWLTLLSALAYLWPRLVPGGWSFDPFVASKPPYLYYLFAATMFAIGGLLPLEEIRRVRSRWWTVLGGAVILAGLVVRYAVLERLPAWRRPPASSPEM